MHKYDAHASLPVCEEANSVKLLVNSLKLNLYFDLKLGIKLKVFAQLKVSKICCPIHAFLLQGRRVSAWVAY